MCHSLLIHVEEAGLLSCAIGDRLVLGYSAFVFVSTPVSPFLYSMLFHSVSAALPSPDRESAL